MIDLHTHTTASDGELTPKQLVVKAKKVGLSAIAITDHDSVAGIDEGKDGGKSGGKKVGIEVVPGVEFSTYWEASKRREFHVLGYFIDYKSPAILKVVERCQKVRKGRAVEMLNKLERLGFIVDRDYLGKITAGSVGKPHVSRVIIENNKNHQKLMEAFGRIPDFSGFIEKYLLSGQVGYVGKEGMTPKQAIDLIKKTGGVSVLAHPGYSLEIGEEDIIRKFVDWGIQGLEAIALAGDKKRTAKCIKHYSELAERYNLLVTGGSDFHREGKPKAGLGLVKWGIEIPDSILEELKSKITS